MQVVLPQCWFVEVQYDGTVVLDGGWACYHALKAAFAYNHEDEVTWTGTWTVFFHCQYVTEPDINGRFTYQCEEGYHPDPWFFKNLRRVNKKE